MPANRRQLYAYKGDRCASCGLGVQAMIETYGDFQRIFELNHIDPSKKHKDYENLIRRDISTEQIDEVDKCVLLCRNCHGIAHQKGKQAVLSVTVRAGERRFEHQYKGQVIRNLQTKTAKFFTDERVMLHPYQVTVGKGEPRILFGQELFAGELVPLMKAIAEIKTLRITSWGGKLMLEMTHSRKRLFKLQQNIAPTFPSRS